MLIEEQVGGIPSDASMLTELSRYAPICKHKTFFEEREWRIVAGPIPSAHPRFDVRSGFSMLTP